MDRGLRPDNDRGISLRQVSRSLARLLMKRLAVLILIVGASGAALYYSKHHKVETPVGPQAVVNALADTQREISRVPAGLVRLSDADETRVGDAMAQRYLAAIASSAADTQLSEIGRASCR